MFETAKQIRQCADELIEALRRLPDTKGTEWTTENFKRLDAFAKSKNSSLESFSKGIGEPSEFLWDFIACSPDTGIFIAAESEQQAHTRAEITALKHDFEKLLYVYAPIRVLITKAKNKERAQALAKTLTAYASGCCLAFNPGSVFILHVGLWYGSGNIFYVWQSAGEPHVLKPEPMSFTNIVQD